MGRSSSSSPALENTMVETAPSQEPTMEEILESIRKIISEEDEPAADAAAAEQAAAPAPAAEEEVLELVDLIEEEEEEGQEESLPEPPTEEEAIEEAVETEEEVETPSPPPARSSAPPPPLAIDDDDEELIKLVSERTTDAGVAAFTDLARAVHGPWPLGDEDKTVEGMVLALLKPLLKEWLDLHLPGLVEELVRHEIERMVRRARPDIFKK
jgi:cell pole-organizing protein PopZ